MAKCGRRLGRKRLRDSDREKKSARARERERRGKRVAALRESEALQETLLPRQAGKKAKKKDRRKVRQRGADAVARQGGGVGCHALEGGGG